MRRSLPFVGPLGIVGAAVSVTVVKDSIVVVVIDVTVAGGSVVATVDTLVTVLVTGAAAGA